MFESECVYVMVCVCVCDCVYLCMCALVDGRVCVREFYIERDSMHVCVLGWCICIIIRLRYYVCERL